MLVQILFFHVLYQSSFAQVTVQNNAYLFIHHLKQTVLALSPLI